MHVEQFWVWQLPLLPAPQPPLITSILLTMHNHVLKLYKQLTGYMLSLKLDHMCIVDVEI